MSFFSDTLKDRFLTIAHRGGASLAPENTLSAAKKAIAVGADMWELDVRMSGDGELIVLHDKTLSRTTNVRDIPKYSTRRPWHPDQFTLAEIRELDAGSWYVATDPFGQIRKSHLSKEETDRYKREHILTLREALSFTKEKNFPVNVEIKNHSDSPGEQVIVQRLADLIDEMGVANQVIVSSFNHGYLKALKSENTCISTAILVSKPLPDPIGLLQYLKADAYHASCKSITPELIKRLRDNGYAVNAYTVNNKAMMNELIAAGVNGIITDFPQVLSRIVQIRKEEAYGRLNV
jgi:glycerophosphoryl diester phosphodiesterase